MICPLSKWPFLWLKSMVVIRSLLNSMGLSMLHPRTPRRHDLGRPGWTGRLKSSAEQMLGVMTSSKPRWRYLAPQGGARYGGGWIIPGIVSSYRITTIL